MCGVVEDVIIPGYYGYEAGQPAVGDSFAWFVDQAVPDYVKQAADVKEMNIHQWLEEKAGTYKPGEIGLLALEWWNVNRSDLVDTYLIGMLLVLTLNNKPEEIYWV